MKKLIVIAALMCGTVHAEFWTGNELLSRINSGDGFDRGVATAYIMGVFDATATVTHCAPLNVTAVQVRDMVAKTLTEGAAARHMSADSFVSYTLKAAWPCADKKRGGTAL